jgi:hypothetical protein
MPSTDIDGSPVVIFSEAEARFVYNHFTSILARVGHENLPPTAGKIIEKIARDLNLPPLELSNHVAPPSRP